MLDGNLGQCSWRDASRSRFAWMFVERQSGKSTPPSPEDLEDFEEACKFALSAWQACPVVYKNLLDWDCGRHADTEAAAMLRDAVLSYEAFRTVSRLVSDRFLTALENDNIAYVTLKGTAVSLSAYSTPAKRIGKDTDVAVHSHALSDAERAARNAGYFHAQWDDRTKRFYSADMAKRAEVEAEHYELGFLARRQIVDGLTDETEAAIRRFLPHQYLWHETENGELACYSCVDIHHGLSLDIDTREVINTRQKIEVSSTSVYVPSTPWMMLHLIYKIYWEGVHTYNKGHYQYADLAALLTKMNSQSWFEFFDLLEIHRLEAAGYYVLRRLESDLMCELPEELETFLDITSQIPDRSDAMFLNDYGDMWPKLWGRR